MLFVLPLILLKINARIYFLVVNQTLPIHRLIFLSLTFKIIDKQPWCERTGNWKNSNVLLAFPLLITRKQISTVCYKFERGSGMISVFLSRYAQYAKGKDWM